MFQIYLLTVLANCFVGFLIAGSFFREKQETCGSILDLFVAPNARLAVGLISLIIGIISLFKTSTPDIVIIGDLLPSIGAILGGLVIGSLALTEKSDEPPAFVNFVVNFTEKISTPLGLAIMAIGVLHALVPTAIII